MSLYLDRFYVAILASVATSCFVNVRILLARRTLLRTKAGLAHLFSNLFGIFAGLILSISETTGLSNATSQTCQLQLSFGCVFVHCAKLLNHIILFWRCEVITHQHRGVRVGFGFLLLCKAIAVSSHCTLMRPFYDVIVHLCLDTFEPISTTATFVLDMMTDATLTGLFMVKIFQHISQLRRMQHPQAINHSTEFPTRSYIPEQSLPMRHLFHEYLYQAVPTLIFSFTLNAIIVSNILQDYTLIVVYIDLIIQLRLSNDLLVLNRLSVGANSTHASDDPPTELKATFEIPIPRSDSTIPLHEVSHNRERNFDKGTFKRIIRSGVPVENYELTQKDSADMERESKSILRRGEQTFPSALSPPPFKRTIKIDEERIRLTEAQKANHKDSHGFSTATSV